MYVPRYDILGNNLSCYGHPYCLLMTMYVYVHTYMSFSNIEPNETERTSREDSNQ